MSTIVDSTKHSSAFGGIAREVMNTCKRGVIGIVTAVLLVFATGYGKQRVGVPAPFVTAATPANGAVGVPINQTISATFSTSMNPATVSSSTFTLAGPGGTVVGGSVTYAAGTAVASLKPGANLAYNTLYTATVTTGVTDSLGDQPAGNYVWSFTTAVQPTVLSVIPVNGAVGVSVNQALSAVFSAPMNPATINASTFTLSAPGTGAVAGTITYTATGSVASFVPSTSLAFNTVYTATITIGAANTAGDPLAANYT